MEAQQAISIIFILLHALTAGLSDLQHVDGWPRETGDAGGNSERNTPEKSTEVGERVWGYTTRWTQGIRGNMAVLLLSFGTP